MYLFFFLKNYSQISKRHRKKLRPSGKIIFYFENYIIYKTNIFKIKDFEIQERLYQKSVLKNWLNLHLSRPFPSLEEKQLLSQQSRLSLIQINDFFKYERRKLKLKNQST